MPTWVYFIHAPRENFADTMTEAEQDAWSRHWARLKALFHARKVVLAGPTLGPTNTGICVIEADDEDEARRLMADDPTIAEGHAAGELRPFRVSLLRGRDERWVASEMNAGEGAAGEPD